MRAFRDMVADLLTLEGAMVETIEPDGLEVLAPEPTRASLKVSEWFRLGFGTELPADAQRVTLESDWLDRFGDLLGKRGALLRLAMAGDLRNRFPDDTDRMLAHAVTLENAAFRALRAEETASRYLTMAFKCAAVSEEKREELLTLCVNESNGACADHLVIPLRDMMETSPTSFVSEPEGNRPQPAWTGAKTAAFARAALESRIRTWLKPFLAGMDRRMKRDMERVHAYHNDLYREAERRLNAKTAKAKDETFLQRERLRRAAIEREYRAKAIDLQRKYEMSVKVELVQMLQVTMPVLRVHLRLLRRKADRLHHLDWNPVSRKLDALSCENCHGESPARFLCDEQLHLACPACYPTCPACGQAWCRVCGPDRCPRCKRQSGSCLRQPPYNPGRKPGTNKAGAD